MGRVVAWAELLAERERLRAEGKRLVFTNGHFDLLHVGHVRYLQQARALGDALAVGVNSDAATTARKGPGRPIVPQDERAEVVAALACVDYVTIFADLTAEGLVAALQPDTYVKGGDYAGPHAPPLPEAQVVAAYGGRVVLLPLVPGRSTSDLVQTVLRRLREDRARE
ncbi:MAG: adenylyltransferase/cytidyltransferase family protein [Chloroflexi bacterium]|nr:adenylyltransferase/cytidyltransferase family protein [Chloroflexota bacterium]